MSFIWVTSERRLNLAFVRNKKTKTFILCLFIALESELSFDPQSMCDIALNSSHWVLIVFDKSVLQISWAYQGMALYKPLSALKAAHFSVHDDIKVKSTVSGSNKLGNQ